MLPLPCEPYRSSYAATFNLKATSRATESSMLSTLSCTEKEHTEQLHVSIGGGVENLMSRTAAYNERHAIEAAMPCTCTTTCARTVHCTRHEIP
jgi:hypothetical protein